MEYKTTTYGESRRVHREYVDVVARFGRDGSLEPVCVLWKDGRAFPVDEVVSQVPYGRPAHGRRTACYHVRFGGHETELYLERREPRPEYSEGETTRWWVYAYDQVLPASKRKEGGQ